MVVRALLSTLNGIAQAGLLARSRIRPGGTARAGRARAAAGTAEPWHDGAYAHAGDEPLLEDLLRDPLVRMMMRADGLEPAQVRRLLLRAGRPAAPRSTGAPRRSRAH
jgi:hypothetical protein